jgi:hypothetical protein
MAFSIIKHKFLGIPEINIAPLPYDRYVELRIKARVVTSNSEYGYNIYAWLSVKSSGCDRQEMAEKDFRKVLVTEGRLYNK